MCFHGNQLSWGIKHPIISLYSKYPSPGFICLSILLAPVISSLDRIYCRILGLISKDHRKFKKVDFDSKFSNFFMPNIEQPT